LFFAALGEDARTAVDLGGGTGACALLLAELGHTGKILMLVSA
jgi:ubiquinone/menaquinone biosynthesis C-methylase UbiE